LGVAGYSTYITLPASLRVREPRLGGIIPPPKVFPLKHINHTFSHPLFEDIMAKQTTAAATDAMVGATFTSAGAIPWVGGFGNELSCYWKGDAPEAQDFVLNKQKFHRFCWSESLDVGVHHFAVGILCKSIKKKSEGQGCSKVAQTKAKVIMAQLLVHRLLRHGGVRGDPGVLRAQLAEAVGEKMTVGGFLSLSKKAQQKCAALVFAIAPSTPILKNALADVLFTALQPGLSWDVKCGNPVGGGAKPVLNVKHVASGVNITVATKSLYTICVNLANTQNSLGSCPQCPKGVNGYAKRPDKGGCSGRDKRAVLLKWTEGGLATAVATVKVKSKSKSVKRKAGTALPSMAAKRVCLPENITLAAALNKMQHLVAQVARLEERLARVEQEQKKDTVSSTSIGLAALKHQAGHTPLSRMEAAEAMVGIGKRGAGGVGRINPMPVFSQLQEDELISSLMASSPGVQYNGDRLRTSPGVQYNGDQLITSPGVDSKFDLNQWEHGRAAEGLLNSSPNRSADNSVRSVLLRGSPLMPRSIQLGLTFDA